MRLAIFSNVQGNIVALDAVLAALEPRDPAKILAVGDIVGLGPSPNAVVDRLRDHEIEAVAGNYDDAVAFDRLSPGMDYANEGTERAERQLLAWTRRTLSEENLAYLRDLPRDLRVFEFGPRGQVRRNMRDPDEPSAGGMLMRALFGGLIRDRRPSRRKQALVAHGTPRALNEYVRADTAVSILETIATVTRADVLISGHGGEGFQREAAGMTFVGAPSVAGPQMPLGEAGYGIVDLGPEITTEFFTVEYDIGEYQRHVAERGLPIG
ncbi:MAG TPA: metallophosphoesterase [Chloroflexota bacterium]|nr:metallophosphoesterase [Chloroflexota bacterium]